MYWVPDADLNESRRLEMVENVGIQAGEKEKPHGEAKLILITPDLLWILRKSLRCFKKLSRKIGNSLVKPRFQTFSGTPDGKTDSPLIIQLNSTYAQLRYSNSKDNFSINSVSVCVRWEREKTSQAQDPCAQSIV